MKFVKSHGTGNDFVMIEDLSGEITLDRDLVRALCDRHFGVGADGVVRVAKGSSGGQFFMDYWNADGSVAEMCGNGIRCLGKYVGDRGLASGEEIIVETRGGLRTLRLERDLGPTGKVRRVQVDMGVPVLERSAIPVAGDGADALRETIEVDGERVAATCLSMGNPHAVLFVDEVSSAPVGSLGPRLETHPLFPSKTNVEFVQVRDHDRVAVRIWERGVGETLSSGTGSCASVVAGQLRGLTGRRVEVAVLGGLLEITWEGPGEPVMMSGPAVEVAEGILDQDWLRASRDTRPPRG